MAANPLPLDGHRQLEEAGTYRNLKIVVLSTPPRCTKVFVVIVNYPGKSSPTVAINAARGFLAGNNDNQSEMRKSSEEPSHFSSGRKRDERSTRDVPHTDG
jgi:hypothetical protein